MCNLGCKSHWHTLCVPCPCIKGCFIILWHTRACLWIFSVSLPYFVWWYVAVNPHGIFRVRKIQERNSRNLCGRESMFSITFDCRFIFLCLSPVPLTADRSESSWIAHHRGLAQTYFSEPCETNFISSNRRVRGGGVLSCIEVPPLSVDRCMYRTSKLISTGVSLEKGSLDNVTLLLYALIYRVIHKSLRDFRTRLRNNQDRHGRKEHINR